MTQINPDYLFEDETLAKVVLIQEVCELWQITRRKVQYAIWKDDISARKAISGGAWLINYQSCVDFWGKPKKGFNDV